MTEPNHDHNFDCEIKHLQATLNVFSRPRTMKFANSGWPLKTNQLPYHPLKWCRLTCHNKGDLHRPPPLFRLETGTVKVKTVVLHIFRSVEYIEVRGQQSSISRLNGIIMTTTGQGCQS